MLELQEVKDYLGIDYDDDMVNRRLNNLIKVAESFLKGAVGKSFDREDARAKELALVVISDLYDNHDLHDKVSYNIRRLINDFALQLQMEARRN